MMKHLGISMEVVCKKDEILAKLKENRNTHARMVAEARLGYVESAKKELGKKLQLLAEGKVTALAFGLQVPKDFTTVYATTINMLESHTGDTIVLTADEYRHLVEDEWDWTREFLTANARYSSSTQAWSVGKGFETE